MSRDQSLTMKYRLPRVVPFTLAMIGMFIITDLAVATGPNTTNWERDVKTPAHWGVISSLFGGYVNYESFMQACFRLWANPTGGSSAVSYYIAVGAWIVHAIEMLFAMRKCVAYGAGVGTTFLYGVGVFLSGIGQFGVLNAEARRIDRLKAMKGA